ncbi:hypothetical protein BDD12DRAFT_886285 [Trichophaea hybrida]|nr:hypothetical protein BDD12DRAFT_886285 [Trichophaea hybrida]
MSLTLDDSPTWDTIVLAPPSPTQPGNTSSGTPPRSQTTTKSSNNGMHERTRNDLSPAPKGTLKEPRIEVPCSLSLEPLGSPVWYGPMSDQKEHTPTDASGTRGIGKDGDIGECCPDEQVAEEAWYKELIERHPQINNWHCTNEILMKLQKLFDNGTGRGMVAKKNKWGIMGYDRWGTLRGDKGTVGRERVVLVQNMYKRNSTEQVPDNGKFWRVAKGAKPTTYKTLF